MTATLAVLASLVFTEAAPGGAVGQQLANPVATRQSAPQTWAQQALAGGHLRPWEKQWATRMARGECGRSAKVWHTQYGMWDPQHYRGSEWHCAANPSHLPLGTVLWSEKTKRLHVVTNRGANYNDRAALKHGGAYWVDIWTRREGQYGWQTVTGRVWIVGRAPWPH